MSNANPKPSPVELTTGDCFTRPSDTFWPICPEHPKNPLRVIGVLVLRVGKAITGDGDGAGTTLVGPIGGLQGGTVKLGETMPPSIVLDRGQTLSPESFIPLVDEFSALSSAVGFEFQPTIA